MTINIRRLTDYETLELFPEPTVPIEDLPFAPLPVTSECILKKGHHFVRYTDRNDDGLEHCTGCGAKR